MAWNTPFVTVMMDIYWNETELLPHWILNCSNWQSPLALIVYSPVSPLEVNCEVAIKVESDLYSLWTDRAPWCWHACLWTCHKLRWGWPQSSPRCHCTAPPIVQTTKSDQQTITADMSDHKNNWWPSVYWDNQPNTGLKYADRLVISEKKLEQVVISSNMN